jgi:uncharacterized protein (DUF362 family)
MEGIELNQIAGMPRVAVSSGRHGYPSESPYSPGTSYPEYPFSSETAANVVNHAYDGVRNVLQLLELDQEHFGQKQWDPLGEIIHPGETVVLKPNFIRDFRETQSGHGDCLITHGSIIRAALDYVYIAIKGKGRIIVADAPQNDADFDEIRRISGLNQIQEFYRQHADFEIEAYDLRPEMARKVDGVICGHEKLAGDPVGYVKVDLGEHSSFSEIDHLCHLLYGAEYDTDELRLHHSNGVHEYLISRTVMDADCVINLPKLKTHKKTGITVCLKNLVGINGNKNWLPHHREGTPAQGGDQFADDGIRHRIERKTMICFRHVFPLFGPARRLLAKPLKALGKSFFGDTNTDTVRSGNWYGNDTTWRMVIDLNRIFMYAGSNGHLQDKPARRVFCLVDGIIGGEGNGPLDTTPKPAGIVLAGGNSVAVDLACAHLMGFDYQRLPLLSRGLLAHPLPLATFTYESIICASNYATLRGPLTEIAGLNMHFIPHFGWQYNL